MIITKYLLLFIWALLLLGITAFICKQLAFGKQKTKETINISEAIYLSSLVISSGLVFQKAMQNISLAFDNIYKMAPSEIYFQFAKTSSAISISGIVLFIMSIYISKFFSTIFFSSRKESVEFDSDNISYALIRASLMISTSLVFVQISENIFTYLIPTITLPFYR